MLIVVSWSDIQPCATNKGKQKCVWIRTQGIDQQP